MDNDGVGCADGTKWRAGNARPYAQEIVKIRRGDQWSPVDGAQGFVAGQYKKKEEVVIYEKITPGDR